MTSTHVSPVPCDLEEEDNRLKFRVCMMGESQVGKTSLVSQCLTSDYMNTYDASLGKGRILMTYGIICKGLHKGDDKLYIFRLYEMLEI